MESGILQRDTNTTSKERNLLGKKKLEIILIEAIKRCKRFAETFLLFIKCTILMLRKNKNMRWKSKENEVN